MCRFIDLFLQQPEDASVGFKGEALDGFYLGEGLAGPNIFDAVGSGIEVVRLEAAVEDDLRLAGVEERESNGAVG
jgi:hypothetical protein